MRIIFLIFFLSIIISCGTNSNLQSRKLYLSYFGDDISPSFKQKVIEAIQEINSDAGSEIISLSKISTNQRPLLFFSIPSSEVYAHAQYLDYRCAISIDQTNSTINDSVVDLQMVILHEIGHCYGLSHTQDSNDIMYPTFDGTDLMTNPQITNLINRMQSFARSLSEID